MQIEIITGVTEKKDIQIQKGCVKSIAIVTTAGAVAAGVIASLKLVTKQGEKILYDKISVLDLFEMGVQGEGSYIKDTLAAAAAYPGPLPVSQARTVGAIPVTSGLGGYQFNDDEYLSLDLEVLTAGTTYRVLTIEDIDVENELLHVDRLSISAPRTSQGWSAGGADYIALPRTNLDKVQLFSLDKDGNNPTISYEELMTMSILDNDITSLSGRTIATTPAVNLMDTNAVDGLIFLNLQGVKNFDIYCTGAAGYNFYRTVVKPASFD